MTASLWGGVAMVVAAAGCGGNADPAVYGAPMELALRVDANAAVGGVVTAAASISGSGGDEYGALMMNARLRLKRDPSSVEFREVTLDAGSLAAPNFVFEAGKIELRLDLGGDEATKIGDGIVFDVTVEPAIPLVTMEGMEWTEAQRAKLVSGGFDVQVVGKGTQQFLDGKQAGTLTLKMQVEAIE